MSDDRPVVLRVLGPVAVDRGEGPEPIRSRLRRSLLALLVANVNRPVTVDRIVEALWSGDDWANGPQRLWFHVSKLRATVAAAGATIELGPGTYRLVIDEGCIDATVFQRRVEQGSAALAADLAPEARRLLTSALSLWRGDPYGDVDEDAVGWGERVRLSELRISAVEACVDARLVLGDISRLTSELESLLVDHPYRETLWLRLMQAQAAAGRPAEALGSYERARQLLADELGVEPGGPLQSYARTVKPSAEPAAVGPRPADPSYGAERFVGRERQLRHLDDAVGPVVGGRVTTPVVRFVRAEAGAGKTRLATELTRQQDLRGAVGLITSCSAVSGPADPYGPILRVAQVLGGGDPVTARVQLSDGAADSMARVGPVLGLRPGLDVVGFSGRATGPGRVGDDLQELFLTWAERVPLLVVVEDLHWVDTETVAFLRALSVAPSGRIAVVGTYRPHDLPLNDACRDLTALEQELQARSREAVVVDLDEVTPTERAQFVDQLLDREPNDFDNGFRADLMATGEGHALYTLEVLADLQTRGSIGRTRGRWGVTGTVGWESWPARIQGVLGSRLSALDDELIEVLRVASVEGEEFTDAVVAHATGLTEDRVVAALSRRAAASGVVNPIGPAQGKGRPIRRYRFAHNLFQRYLYERIDQAERSHLHAKVAAGLIDSLGDTDELASTLALHYEQAGDRLNAARQHTEAARRGLRLSAYRRAEHDAQRALALLGEVPEQYRPTRTRSEALLLLGLAQSLLYGFPSVEVEQTYQLAIDVMRNDPPNRRLPVVFGLFVGRATRGEFDRAGELAELAGSLAEAAGDDGLRVQALHARFTQEALAGNYDRAHPAFDRCRSLYRHNVHHRQSYRYANHNPIVCGLSLTALCHLMQGDTVRAERHLHEAADLARAADHPPSLVQPTCWDPWIRSFDADPDDLDRRCREALRLEESMTAPIFFGSVRRVQGLVALRRGHADEAIAVLEAELAVQQRMRNGSWVPLFAADLAQAYLAAGRPDDARRVLVPVADVAPERMGQSEIYRLQGEAALAEGDRVEADAWFRRACETSERVGALTVALLAGCSLTATAPDDARAYLHRIVGRLPPGHRSLGAEQARQLIGSG
ncbi:MAG: BTAD domain-containing putative transcriptional regulator [Acidimicrobiales bacterium]